MDRKIINVGILAHVDAGKTTISENILFLGGAIKTKGSVDKGSSQTDYLDIERERGISVRCATSTIYWNDIQINLIDTPGHVDFSAELERNLRILDSVVLIISAAEGVQAHTETIWNTLRHLDIPVIIFINKIDRIGANSENVILEIKKELTSNVVVLQNIIDEESNNAYVESVFNNEFQSDDIIEIIADNDECILEKYLEEMQIPFNKLDQVLVEKVEDSSLFPVLFGSAKNEIGIKELLDAIIKFMPNAKTNSDDELSAVVFRVDHNDLLGKVAGVRIFNGKIYPRDLIKNHSQNIEEKVSQIKRYNGNKLDDISFVSAGDIVAVSGMSNVKVGDVLGDSLNVPEEISMRNSLLTVRVNPEQKKDYYALAEAMQQLSYEDPALEFEWFKEDQELNVKIMGWIQIQIMVRILEDRFGIKAKFDNPTVIYKETPKKKAEGYVRYWMPKPCWAILKFIIEPGDLGSGVIYESKIGVNDVLQKYQNEVASTIPQSLKQGIKGWEVTDVKITLIEGEDHVVHSRSGNFKTATPMGIMNGLVNSDTSFLEPYISFRIIASEELLGAITSDITQMRGSFDSPEIDDEKFIIKGIMPMASSTDYPVKLSSRSGGKARISTKFHSYQLCDDDKGVIRPYKGISPLDEAKWILKARKALDS